MTTPKLALPELAAGQAGKELTHNQALAVLDQLAMPRVVDKDLTAPPGSPANGALYIPAPGSTGAWSGKAGYLAWWLSSVNAYTFLPPGLGMSVRVLDELDASGLPKIYAYSGSAWIEQPVSSFAGGTLTSALNEAPIVTLASASTVSIGGASANTISISGTTAIIAFDVIAAGAVRRLVFQGALTLTHHSTAQILPGGANITTAAGDVADFVSLGSGNWRCINYMRANGQAVAAASSSTQWIPLACSDEVTALTTGTAKTTFRMGFGLTLSGIRASLTTAQTSGALLTVNVKVNGTTILSTKLTFDNTEKTTVTATTPPVISNINLPDDAEVTVDIDQVGDGTAKGLKVYLLGMPV